MLTAPFRYTPAQRACRAVGLIQMGAGALSAVVLWADNAPLSMVGVVLFAAGLVLRYLP